MGWLLGGILYSSIYAVVGWLLRDHPQLLSWFRAGALLLPRRQSLTAAPERIA